MFNTSQQAGQHDIVGSSIADDTATVSGGFNPTGTVTFNLYNNSTGTGPALFTDPDVPLVSGVATSTGYTATATGPTTGSPPTTATANNNSVTQRHRHRAGDDHQGHADDHHQPRRRPAATVGSSIADTATVSGGLQPHRHGHLQPLQQLDRHRPSPVHRHRDAQQSAAWPPPPATRPRRPAPTTGSPPTTATANNNPVTSGTATEPVTITTATPTINTSQQPASTTVGTSIADKATVSGGFNPTGTVTFNLYNNSTGTGPALFTDPDVPLVSGVATSTGYTATATGTDYWVATYNGDANNNRSATAPPPSR